MTIVVSLNSADLNNSLCFFLDTLLPKEEFY